MSGKTWLEIKGEFENVQRLSMDGSEARFFFKVRCMHCGEKRDDTVYVTPGETMELPTGHDEVHLMIKCALCEHKHWVKLLDVKETFSIDATTEEFERFALFQVRGVELSDFEFRGNWIVEAASGKRWADVDLSGKEWSEYDDDTDQPIGIYDLDARFANFNGS